VFALNRTERRAAIGVAVCAFVAAFACVPGQAGGHRAATGPQPATSEPLRALPADVVPVRDPFAPRIIETDPESGPVVPPRIAPLPANAGAGRFPFAGAPAAPPRLLAVVRGPAPGALIDERGTTRFVTVGERVAGARISAIDDDGLVLDDGRRIALTRATLEGQP
jgi:hypothetical protein